jgi:hypothetical protein
MIVCMLLGRIPARLSWLHSCMVMCKMRGSIHTCMIVNKMRGSIHTCMIVDKMQGSAHSCMIVDKMRESVYTFMIVDKMRGCVHSCMIVDKMRGLGFRVNPNPVHTCMMVLAASTGMRKMRKAPADALANSVLANTGRFFVES